MAHFAKLDNTNTVEQVIVVNNSECMVDGVENEEVGIAFCKSLYGEDTKWVQTSYNNNFRKIYAYTGCTYDPVKDVFIPPRPAPSWIFDEYAHCWIPPVMYPIEGGPYLWDMQSESWVEIPKLEVTT